MPRPDQNVVEISLWLEIARISEASGMLCGSPTATRQKVLVTLLDLQSVCGQLTVTAVN